MHDAIALDMQVVVHAYKAELHDIGTEYRKIRIPLNPPQSCEKSLQKSLSGFRSANPGKSSR